MPTATAPPSATPWYDKRKYRRCQDGSDHEGRLELITWSTPAQGLGFAACDESESEDLKQKFEQRFGGDEEKFFDYWSQGFRWTCCGTPGDQMFGCDHHGQGSKKCTCDFCKMGQPIPDNIKNLRIRSPHGHGLNLPRGPDPRSHEPQNAGFHAATRQMLGSGAHGV